MSGEPYMKTYRIAPNYCQCHPETCCCKPYAVIDPEGDKHSTHMHYEQANETASALNSSTVDKTPCPIEAQDRIDAKRYRWLRAINSGSIAITTISIDPDLERHLVEDEADAMIDAAMLKFPSA